jgi:hypothetical protein
MVDALLFLHEKQRDNVGFNFRDARGSFTTLVARGLIKNKTIIKDGKKEPKWEVTEEAIAMLTDLGFAV